MQNRKLQVFFSALQGLTNGHQFYNYFVTEKKLLLSEWGIKAL